VSQSVGLTNCPAHRTGRGISHCMAHQINAWFKRKLGEKQSICCDSTDKSHNTCRCQ
jgi:hypothetical protein